MNQVWEEIEQLLVHKDRVITEIEGNNPGPAIAFCAGLHGNEPSGVLALKEVFETIQKENIPVNGKLIAFIGNRNALHNKERYAEDDLNRMWTKENVDKLHNIGFDKHELNPEILEMIEIDDLLKKFICCLEGEDRFFIDLHTTSAPSVPFAAIDKQPLSYSLALKLPIPFVSNLDDFIKGTLMYYLDHIKFRALVFEAGMHDDPASIQKQEALIWLVLGLAGAIEKENIPNYEGCFTLLQGLSEHPHKVFNILYRHNVEDNSKFQMIPGFINFQLVEEGSALAIHNDKEVVAPYSGNIFMPLYQNQGGDGFFIIERTDKYHR
ncbi:MAG: succinylglutamate desuccinylase/aspartoacylase family protein [Bacteroidota bacterium]